MARTFYRKKFTNYLGEQRAIDDIVMFFTADIGPGPTPTPSITPSHTPTPSITPSSTPIISVTTTPTPTQTNTPTTTTTLTATPTLTPTQTPTSSGLGCDFTYFVNSTPTPTITSTPTSTPSVVSVDTYSLASGSTIGNSICGTFTNYYGPTSQGGSPNPGEYIYLNTGLSDPAPNGYYYWYNSGLTRYDIFLVSGGAGQITSRANDVGTCDVDAYNYLNAVITTGGTVTDAIYIATNRLFIQLKGAGLYSKTIAMYPYIGNVQNSNALEAKNPGTYNITFNGGWTFNSSGATPNGTTGWATNNMYLNTVMTLNNAALFTYLGTDFTTVAGDYCLDFGTADNLGINGLNGLIGGNQLPDTTSYFYNNDGGATRITIPSSVISTGIGLFGYNRTSSTNFNVWRNTVKLATNTNTNTGVLPSVNPLYMPCPGAPTIIDYVSRWSVRRHQFDWIGEGLSDSEATNLQTIINTFQTTLGRNTY